MLLAINHLDRYVPVSVDPNTESKINSWDKAEVLFVELKAKVELLYESLNAIPRGLLPSPVLVAEIRDFKANTAEGDPVYKYVQELDTDCRRMQITRKMKMIAYATEVTPFKTFKELVLNYDDADAQQKFALADIYNSAVSKLFNHPKIEESLLKKIEGKMAILGVHGNHDHEELKHRVMLFTKHFDECKVHNLAISQNQELMTRMRELEAIIFFQENTKVLNQGDSLPTDDLGTFINYWKTSLAHLTEEDLAHKIILVQALEQCSDAHDLAIKKLALLRQAS